MPASLHTMGPTKLRLAEPLVSAAHAPDRLHEEVSADYDLPRLDVGDRGKAQGIHPQMAAEMSRGR